MSRRRMIFMITGFLGVIGVLLGIVFLVALAALGIKAIIMHGLRGIVDGIKWIFRIDSKKGGEH